MRRIIFFIHLFLSVVPCAFAQQLHIAGPAGSGSYGTAVKVLPNGNYVVTDPTYDEGLTPDVGAVYLYDGETHALISTLKGSQPNDFVGGGGITVLANGHFVVTSFTWDNGSATNAGAVTWGNAFTGVEGVVSASNSLVGSQVADLVGSSGVLPLPNGSYLVRSSDWDNGSITNAGAVTWGDGNVGVIGEVSSSNSLVGNSSFDLSPHQIHILNNGHYVVCAPFWNNGSAIDAGAVTWGNRNTGVSGVISITNSLIGEKSQDRVGYGFNFQGGIVPLPNGNFVVRSPDWDNGAAANAGAVTWVNGSVGITGMISAANSLVGSQLNDLIGRGIYNNNDGIKVLPNGNYIVASPSWNNSRGAVTLCNGGTGMTGVVSSANSIVGSPFSMDQIGSGTIEVADSYITILTNGNFVISSPFFTGLHLNGGAVTFCEGTTGLSGFVTPANSLVSNQANDFIGRGGVRALTNGNYVVISQFWNNGGISNAGAVTWCNGTTGLFGAVNTSNSLVGAQASDNVGNGGVTALSNGNYVVNSHNWRNSTITNAGAVTWGNGVTGITGVVTSVNSLVGGKANDYVGNGGVTALSNGNYVVRSFEWDNGSVTNAGAVTWGNGSVGVTGLVSSSNSLVGTQNNDAIGYNTIQALPNGNYVVRSAVWDNGSISNAGAVTFGNGATGISGVVSASNSLIGSKANDQVGNSMIFALPNSNYVVNSGLWDNGSVVDAGAVTFSNGNTGLTGLVGESNSLVGSSNADNVGFSPIQILPNGNYLVRAVNWKNGSIVNAGAFTLGDKDVGITGTINPCQSVTGNSINATLTGAFDYNAVYDYVIVGFSSENRIVIYKSAENAVVASISSVTTVLNCSTPSIELTASGGVQYSWSGGLGNSATAIVTTPGIYTVTVSDINGCTDEASIEITQNIVLPATPVVSGPVNVCMFEGTQTPVSYSVMNDPNATSYEWIVPPTTTLVSGQGTSSIEIEINTGFSISANKQIRVRAISGCGNSAWTIYYLHAQAPTTPATISGLQEVCSLVGTGNETTYFIQPVLGASNYVWSVPSGVIITQNNGTSIDVEFESSFNNGNIRVLAQNNCGVSTFRSIAVSKTLPSTPGLISGPTNMCLLKPDLMNPFGSTAEYKISLVAGATSYAWSLPPGITLLNQYSTATENIAFVEIGSGYNGGNIGVVASNNCGTSNSRVLRLNVLQPGAPPAIDVTELSVCPARIYRYSLGVHPSNSSYIQWSVPAEAEILNGFYTNTIEVLYPNTAISGEVTASAINGCGVSSIRRLKIKLSACQEVLSKSAQDDYDIFVYPNPSSSSFNLDLGKVHSLKGLVEMIVTDVLGRVLYANRVNAGEVIQFGNELKPGTYLIEIKQGTFRKVSKIVKL